MKAPATRFEDLLVWQQAHLLIFASDLECSDISGLTPLLEEVNQRLEAYSQAILDSDP
jgi:hypothetical protein